MSCLLLLSVCLVPSVQAEPIWIVETADSASNVIGTASSLAIDAAGNPHISYCTSSHDLMYAKKTGDTWSIQNLDSLTVVGTGSSIALDSTGTPHITYTMTSPSTYVLYMTKNDLGWYNESVAKDGSLFYTSLKLDSSNKPHVVFLNNTDSTLMYATKTPTGWRTEIVDTHVGSTNSLAIDVSGNPHISYFDESNLALKYAVRRTTEWVIETVDDTYHYAGQYSSIALDSLGNPHISYYFQDAHGYLRYASKTGETWTIETVDDPGTGKNVGQFTSIALDAYDIPHISYYDQTNDNLKYATKTGTTWVTTTIDSVGDVGNYNSIALDPQGKPHISYHDGSHQDLKYASLCDFESVQTSTGTGIASFTTSAGEITGLTAISEDSLPSEGKPDMTFPQGFFSFNIEGLADGQSVMIEITFPDNVPVGSQYWKYQNNQWIQIPIGSDDGDNVIYIVLTDGGIGDSDGEANGVIVDPGGIAVNGGHFVVPETPIATALISMFAALSVFVLFKRQKQKSLLA
jgi:hypothetical protein